MKVVQLKKQPQLLVGSLTASPKATMSGTFTEEDIDE